MPLIVEPETVEQLLAEGAEPVSRLTRYLPPVRGKVRDPWTLARWIRTGKERPAGAGVVRLEGFAGPDGAWWSSRAALARFLSRLSGEADAPPDADWTRRVVAGRKAFDKEMGRKAQVE